MKKIKKVKLKKSMEDLRGILSPPEGEIDLYLKDLREKNDRDLEERSEEK